MANFNGAARTNVFRVKDVFAFIEAVNRAAPEVTVEHRSRGDDLPGQVMMFSADVDTGCWPCSGWWDPEEGEAPFGVTLHNSDGDGEIDWSLLLSTHMVDGEVCIIMEAGSEKLRYISGWAQAIHSSGRSVAISLSSIYDLAVKEFNVLGTSITPCSY